MINYFRDMVGLRPVALDPALDAQAQQAALIMAANNALSHTPPSSWKCWNQTGSDAAAHSNLHRGVQGAEAIAGYMDDHDVPRSVTVGGCCMLP